MNVQSVIVLFQKLLSGRGCKHLIDSEIIFKIVLLYDVTALKNIIEYVIEMILGVYF